ncbi:MAG: hypothetical protein U0794_03340 [Isosphaeraceae bacterium]
MEGRHTRRALLGLVVLGCAGLGVGCQSSNDIPLVEFPKGAPPPPEAAKNAGPPQGSNTSQGDPAR